MKKSIGVVLDTSVLFNDYRLNQSRLIQLLTLASKDKVDVLLPSVVIDEHVGHYELDYRESLNNIEKSLENLRKLSLEKMNVKLPIQKKSYSEFLKREIEKKGIKVVDYPSVSHRLLASKAIVGHKPFKADRRRDDGYKDALIWESIISLLSQSSSYNKIIFVSVNYKDFADAQLGPLHKDLQSELEERGLARESVIYVNSLAEATKLLEKMLKTTKRFDKDKIITEVGDSIDFSELITENKEEIEDFIEKSPHSSFKLHNGWDIEVFWDTKRLTDIHLYADKLTEKSYLMSGSLKCHAYIEYSVFLHDYYGLSEDAPDIVYEDSEHDLGEVGKHITLLVDFNFIYNSSNRSASDFQVEDVRASRALINP